MSDIKVTNELNAPLVNHFLSIASLYLQAKDSRRFSTFRKVATILSSVEDEIKLETDITEHPGIGDSSWEIQQAFLKTGTSPRYAEAEQLVHAMEVELDSRTLEEKIADKVSKNLTGTSAAQVTASLVMWTAMNGLSDAQSMLDNIDSAPPYIRDAGLADIITKFK